MGCYDGWWVFGFLGWLDFGVLVVLGVCMIGYFGPWVVCCVLGWIFCWVCMVAWFYGVGCDFRSLVCGGYLWVVDSGFWFVGLIRVLVV